MKMSSEQVMQIVHDFLNFLGDVTSDPLEGISRLESLLDQLALARHSVTYTFDDVEYPDAPEWPYVERRALIAKKFPILGSYNTTLSITESVATAELSICDSVDDVADIAGDLHEIYWAWLNTSQNNALWLFANSFDSHWGRHLRDLQLYLHCARSEL